MSDLNSNPEKISTEPITTNDNEKKQKRLASLEKARATRAANKKKKEETEKKLKEAEEKLSKLNTKNNDVSEESEEDTGKIYFVSSEDEYYENKQKTKQEYQRKIIEIYDYIQQKKSKPKVNAKANPLSNYYKNEINKNSSLLFN